MIRKTDRKTHHRRVQLQMEKMGLADVLAVYQAAYDRYMK